MNAQVKSLQRILNQDQDTRVVNSGPGSPGNETNFFGLRTKSAVVRFQEKYAGEILAPAGINRGNGYVGFFTRAKLNALSSLTQNTVEARISTASPINSPSSPADMIESPVSQDKNSILSTGPVPQTTPQNPNFKNLDRFLSAIERAAAKKGLSSSEIDAIKRQVVKNAATTTDLRATFLKEVKNKPRQTAENSTFIHEMLLTIGQAFSNIFKPEHAQALAGLPFGGALLYAEFCEDSYTWIITLEPLPPTFPILLTYVPESQLYLSYNIPLTAWLLGEYMPGAGVCVTACPFCIWIPSEGMITPMVGSSLM